MCRNVSTVLRHCFEIPTYKTQKGYTGKGCWPHPRVRSLSRSGTRGHCRYPEDRVPPRTSSKSRQRTRQARVPMCPEAPVPASRLGATGPPRVLAATASASQFGAAPGPPRATMAPAPASRLGVAPRPLRVTWAPAPAFWFRAAPELPHVLRTGSACCKQLNKYPLATRPS
jgi:hypothetical protein